MFSLSSFNSCSILFISDFILFIVTSFSCTDSSNCFSYAHNMYVHIYSYFSGSIYLSMVYVANHEPLYIMYIASFFCNNTTSYYIGVEFEVVGICKMAGFLIHRN